MSIFSRIIKIASGAKDLRKEIRSEFRNKISGGAAEKAAAEKERKKQEEKEIRAAEAERIRKLPSPESRHFARRARDLRIEQEKKQAREAREAARIEREAQRQKEESSLPGQLKKARSAINAPMREARKMRDELFGRNFLKNAVREEGIRKKTEAETIKEIEAIERGVEEKIEKTRQSVIDEIEAIEKAADERIRKKQENNTPEKIEERRLKRNEYQRERRKRLKEEARATEYIIEAEKAIENIEESDNFKRWADSDSRILTEEERIRQLYYDDTMEVIKEKIERLYEKHPKLRPVKEQTDDIIKD